MRGKTASDLIGKARSYKGRARIFSDEQIGLFVGWIRGEYGISAVNTVSGKRAEDMTGYIDICRGLRQAVSQGKVKIT